MVFKSSLISSKKLDKSTMGKVHSSEQKTETSESSASSSSLNQVMNPSKLESKTFNEMNQNNINNIKCNQFESFRPDFKDKFDTNTEQLTCESTSEIPVNQRLASNLDHRPALQRTKSPETEKSDVKSISLKNLSHRPAFEKDNRLDDRAETHSHLYHRPAFRK